MTSLVTGATGCLGSRLVERLTAEGETARVLVRPQSQSDFLRSLNVEMVTGDLREEATLKRAVADVDVVYHCAAWVAEGGPWAEFSDCNIRGTERLLSAATAAAVTRFVHVSSIGIYGPNGKQRVEEEDGYDPYPWRRGFYTWSKIEADRLALRHGRSKSQPAVVVIRPGILYGPRAKPFVARLQLSWRDKLTVIVGGPQALLPLVHVDSVVTALLLAGRGRGQSGTAYNIVDNPVTQSEYLQWQWNGRERKPRVLYLPFSGVYALTATLEVIDKRRFRPLRYRLLRVGRSVVYDTTRAEQELGWPPASLGKRSLEERP
jgi:nucleoside-diphosphate-sugar epimerase